MHGWAVGQQPLGLPFRSVWIEKESINSVIVSDSPEDLHQRMLVAAALSVNATGECGTLRSSVLRSSLLSLTLATGDVCPLTSEHIYASELSLSAIFHMVG